MLNLVSWCSDNNLSLNIAKTKGLILYFRRSQNEEYTPLFINGDRVNVQLQVSGHSHLSRPHAPLTPLHCPESTATVVFPADAKESWSAPTAACDLLLIEKVFNGSSSMHRSLGYSSQPLEDIYSLCLRKAERIPPTHAIICLNSFHVTDNIRPTIPAPPDRERVSSPES